MFIVRIIPVLLVASLATSAFAQQPPLPQLAAVKGATVDFLGARVHNVTVVFDGAQGTHTVVSNVAGEFEIQLPAGQYRVSVARSGIYYPYERKKLKVSAGRVKKFDVILKYDIKKYPPVVFKLDAPNKSLDASGGSVFLKFIRPAMID
jgi:uncharacterized membrane protein